ncbi:hypothetical protein [Leucobacter aridicollis]|uniref:Uncharacterized protein n=1 Tax=Leucobacter aridicollis TaxID=283878 RepID=A0A852RDH4_9MICO|nr:hypothetical protein [Leucobacter aridicollis]MBL3682023.1 hypothetical protein [Leucobacter aridicollis]NYD26930.1 hypothetical protein [Leucobacter aridicollis]
MTSTHRSVDALVAALNELRELEEAIEQKRDDVEAAVRAARFKDQVPWEALVEATGESRHRLRWYAHRSSEATKRAQKTAAERQRALREKGAPAVGVGASEAAALLGIGRARLYQLVGDAESGEVRGLRFELVNGRKRFFPQD